MTLPTLGVQPGRARVVARRVVRLAACLVVPLLLLVATAGPVLAHDAPEGSEWVMGDWMFLSFVLIGVVGLIALIAAFKVGWLSNVEEAKYHLLEIVEDDYYTPTWARSEE